MGDYTAHVVLDGLRKPRLEWIKPDGKIQKSVPAPLKESHADDIKELLDPIGFTVQADNDGTLLVVIPSWRPDSSIEVDVIEEIARHHGYDKSGLRVPTPTQAGRLSPAQSPAVTTMCSRSETTTPPGSSTVTAKAKASPTKSLASIGTTTLPSPTTAAARRAISADVVRG